MNLRRRLTFLTAIYDWFAPAGQVAPADLIFVLAGAQRRKAHALQLFRQGLAPRILLSVGRVEIRRFADLELPVPLNLLQLARDVPPHQRHFFVCFEGNRPEVEQVLPGRFGTLTEMEALAGWVHKRPGIASILVVSSFLHLPRIRLCCRVLLPAGIRVRLVPVPESESRSGWERVWRDDETRVTVLSELIKIAAYKLILWLRRIRRQHRECQQS